MKRLTSFLDTWVRTLMATIAIILGVGLAIAAAVTAVALVASKEPVGIKLLVAGALVALIAFCAAVALHGREAE